MLYVKECKVNIDHKKHIMVRHVKFKMIIIKTLIFTIKGIIATEYKNNKYAFHVSY